ncbi:hypothetical protein ACO0OL_002264 [Hanseniaspora opuntiae]
MTSFDPEQLIKQLTIDEKIQLLTAKDYWHTVPIPRLNIPSIKVTDGPCGSRGSKSFNSTKTAAFPCGTALGSLFDKKRLFEVGQAMAIEAQHKSAKVILGPTTNIQRGPLGGRGFESISEDPLLSGLAAAELVNGIQSSGEVMATMKHFVCNDMEIDRFAYDVMVTDRALREVYLEPFRLAVKHSDPMFFMTAYNKVQGVHCSTSSKNIKDILHNEWNSRALVMSDWYGSSHPMESIKAGLDFDFPGPEKFRSVELIKHLLFSKAETRDGSIFTEHDIDLRVEKILNMIKYFVDVYGTTDFTFDEDTSNNTPETSQFLRQVAAESIVLLKNEDSVLPLKLSDADDLCIIGPNAKAKCHTGGGSASLNAYYVVSPYEGILNVTEKSSLPYSKGCDAHKTLSNFIENCHTEDGQTGLSVKFYQREDYKESGESPFMVEVVDRSFNKMSDLRDPHIDVNEKLFYCDWEGFYTCQDGDGVYELGCQVAGTALVYLDDKLIIDNKHGQVRGDFAYKAGTIEKTSCIEMKHGQTYKVRVAFGSIRTSELEMVSGTTFGALQLGINKVIDAVEEIQYAVSLAKKHKNCIVVIGLNGEYETEGDDRPHMHLPGLTDTLVSEVLKANPNAIVVNQSGTPVTVPWIDQCKVFLQAYYGGNELGNAIADVIFGNVNPGGKLSLSWPKKNEDNPAFLNFTSHLGRVVYGEDIYVGYKYYDHAKRPTEFPFGFGLSYTTFEFSDLKTSLKGNDLLLEVTVKNTGSCAGSEVVQIYTSRVDESQVPRVPKELKEFEKVHLAPNEQTVVKFKLSVKDSFSYFNEIRDQWHLEKGKYSVSVGNSSSHLPLKEDVVINDDYHWSGL